MKLSELKLSSIRSPKTVLSIILQISILLFSFGYPLLYPPVANATVTTAYVRLDRQSAGAALSGVACLQTTTATTVARVDIIFPVSFVISSTPANWTTDTTAANLPSGATAWPTIGSPATGVAGTTVYFSSGSLTSGTFYCFHFIGASSNTGTAGSSLTGSLITKDATNTPIDTVNWATAITTGTNSEQITVTASVSASFSFALSGGSPGQSLALGTLNSGSVTTAPTPVTATISTNARNGFISWVKGTNSDGLHSPTAASGISSPGTFPTVTDLASATGYGIFGTTGTNTPSIDAGYTSGNSTSVGHVDNGQFDRIAYLTGQQSGTTFTINARAKPTATQPAANDYSDTLTVVASGSF